MHLVAIQAALFLLHQLLNSTTELVGARCGLPVAAYALESCNHILVLHAFYKAAYSLQITVATTVEFYIDYNAVVACEFNET